MGRTSSRHAASAAAACARFALAGTLAVGALVAGTPCARAEASEADVAQARELFKQAVKDEEARRFHDALDKLQRVEQVRSTPAVRYRIASCREGLGQLRAARDGFRAVATDAQTADPELAKSATERAAALDKRLGRVVVRFGPGDDPAARVTVDGELAPREGDAARATVDPGPHVVTVEGARPRTSRVVVGEGSEVEVPSGDGAASAPASPAPVTAPAAPAVDDDSGRATRRTLGVVALAVGGALAVGSLVVVGLRAGDISTLEDACPGGRCPRSREDELTGVRDRALVEGPLALGLGVGAAAALGAGVWLYLANRPTGAASRPEAGSAAFVLRPSVVPAPGGGRLVLGGTF